LPHSQDICYALRTARAVRNVVTMLDCAGVGSTNSSNSNRLVEVSRNLGTIGYLIDNSQAIDPAWLEALNCCSYGSASAPNVWKTL